MTVINSIVDEYKRYKALADAAISQVGDSGQMSTPVATALAS
jgi:hypothetical protein